MAVQIGAITRLRNYEALKWEVEEDKEVDRVVELLINKCIIGIVEMLGAAPLVEITSFFSDFLVVISQIDQKLIISS